MQGPTTWSELEARLSGRQPGSSAQSVVRPVRDLVVAPEPDRTPTGGTPRPVVPYAELHCHSNFSFLDGASHPEELAEEAHRLGLTALAVTDHNGLYGVVRFAEAARAVGLPTVFGSEITVQSSTGPQHLVVLADGTAGYARLSRALSLAQLAGSKGDPRCTMPDLAEVGAGHWWVLTGCRQGAVPAALIEHGPSVALRELQKLITAFGRDRVLVELWDHGDPLDTARNDAMAELAARADVQCVATNNVHYATPSARRLATAIAAVNQRCSLDEIDHCLPAAATAHLRSGAEQARRFARYPGVIDLAAEIGRAAAFDLSLVAPKLPPYPCPTSLWRTSTKWGRPKHSRAGLENNRSRT